MFPLPDDYSEEPQPLTADQVGELTVLFKLAKLLDPAGGAS